MTVGDDFPRQQARLRELMLVRQADGDVMAVFTLEQTLRRADEAAISGDIVAIVQAYEAMVRCT